MPAMSSVSAATPDPPKLWERHVLAAYWRMLGATQKEAGAAVGRSARTIRDWEADGPTWMQAREEARRRWLNELTDAARLTLLKTIREGHGMLAMQVLERVDEDLAPATQRLKVQHEVGEGLSGLLKAFGGHDAHAG
jgi:hypothetical protein